MSKYLKKFTLAIALSLIFIQPLLAESIKTIKLKDGSILKGQVIQLTNGTYTIKTSQFGEVKIPESNIFSIVSPQAASQQTDLSSSKTQLKNQVQQLQGSLLSDPALMKEIQGMVQNKEIMKILSDQNVVNDVMSYDQNRIENNDKIKSLMNNPDMQRLMNKIGQQMGK